MQMVERPWGVASYGAASVRSMPDLARVRFRITRLQQTPSQAFESAGHAVRVVRDSLRRHGVPDAAVDRSRLVLASAWSGFGADRKFLGFQCQAAFGVETRNLDGLEPLVVDLVAAGANEIEGIDFDVAAKRELRAQARREAVAAARDKAQLYAEAAGVKLGPVIHIDDVDPEQLSQELHRGNVAGGSVSAGDFSPGHVVVSAAVILGFSITHG